jgi:hypothetical protein
MTNDQAPMTNVLRSCLVGHWSLVIGHFLTVLAPNSVRAELPPVIPATGDPYPAALEAIVPEGRVTFRVEADGVTDYRTLPIADFVRWSHPRPLRPQTLVLVDDGSQLVAAAEWSGGAAARLDGETLVVLTDLWDEVRVPKQRVRGLVFAQRGRPRQREDLAQQIRASGEERDAVLLTNGDRLVGTIDRLDGGSLALTTDAGRVDLPLSRIDAVIFAADDGTKAATEQDAKLAVGLRDGSLLHAKAVDADADQLEIELSAGVDLSGGTRDDIASLQSLGGHFTYLSDLEPADYRHVPYLEIPWPFTRDRNVLGAPLTVGGKRNLKGIGMHSAGRLTYGLDGTYRKFEAAVAVDDAAEQRGSVVFGVHVLRDGKWQPAFTSRTLRGGMQPERVSVDLRGAQALTLTVDYADRGDELDYADWLDARFVK